MTIFKFNAYVTVSAYTEVEAETEAEARAILADRELANLTHNALSPDPCEAWHIDTDGEPENITLAEATHD